MTVKDLVEKKDYDYISYRLDMPGIGDVFIGSCKFANGELISSDGDNIYYLDDEVLSYEEWSNPDKNIKNGLTVVVSGEDV